MSQAESLRPAEELQTPNSERTRFRPDIEGLRAVAVLAVVLFHAEMPGLSGGFVGVDVFFVVSGFLITGLLWREAHGTGTVRLRTFYAARARRLLPASALVGIVTMIASVALLPPLQARTVVGDGIASALYVSNYWFIVRGVDYFAGHLPASPFQHYWSLGVEEQFYLVWPALILGTAALIRLVRRRTRTQALASTRPYLAVLAVVVVVSFALSFITTYVLPVAAFFSLPTRAWQLGAGALIALTATRWQRMSARTAAITGGTGLAMIVLACTTLTASTLYPGTAALLPTLGAVLVIAAGCAAPTAGCGRLLGTAPMRAIGRISYSWYLWHWPVLILAAPLLGHSLGLPGRLIAAALSAALAVLTLRLVENPLRYAPAIRRSARAGLGLGAAATAAAVAAGLVMLHVVPTPQGTGTPAAPLTLTAAPGLGPGAALSDLTAQVQTALAAARTRNDVPSNLSPALADVAAEKKALAFDGCLLSPFAVGQPNCVWGDTASSTTVALVGDSHAAMWTPAFQQLATQRHWRMELIAKGACPLIAPPIRNPLHRLVERIEHCDEWRAQALARVRAERPAVIALSVWRGYGIDESVSGYRAFNDDWIAAMTTTVQQLRDTGATVVVLGPVPDPHFMVPICLSGYLDDVGACTPKRSDAVDVSGITAENAAVTAGGGHYADLTDLFCTPERCPPIVGSTLVYLDETHVTLAYARLLAPAIAALTDRALDRHAPG